MVFRQIGIGVARGIRRVVKNLSIQNFMEYLYATIAVFSNDWSSTTHDRCIENAHGTRIEPIERSVFQLVFIMQLAR